MLFHRRSLLVRCGWVALSAVGCRGHQYGHLVKDDQSDMVGSHAAGAEVYNPLVAEAVGKLLARQAESIHEVSYSEVDVVGSGMEYGLPAKKTICFVGVENKSIEELGDFKEQIYQQIDTLLSQSDQFRPISRRMVDAALRETRLRPDALFIPGNMRVFAATLEQAGQPFDYLMYATITSGTTVRNRSEQRDYQLTLDLVNLQTGDADKESAQIRKGYHKTRAGAWWNYNPFTKASY